MDFSPLVEARYLKLDTRPELQYWTRKIIRSVLPDSDYP